MICVATTTLHRRAHIHGRAGNGIGTRNLTKLSPVDLAVRNDPLQACSIKRLESLVGCQPDEVRDDLLLRSTGEREEHQVSLVGFDPYPIVGRSEEDRRAFDGRLDVDLAGRGVQTLKAFAGQEPDAAVRADGEVVADGTGLPLVEDFACRRIDPRDPRGQVHRRPVSEERCPQRCSVGYRQCEGTTDVNRSSGTGDDLCQRSALDRRTFDPTLEGPDRAVDHVQPTPPIGLEALDLCHLSGCRVQPNDLDLTSLHGHGCPHLALSIDREIGHNLAVEREPLHTFCLRIDRVDRRGVPCPDPDADQLRSRSRLHPTRRRRTRAARTSSLSLRSRRSDAGAAPHLTGSRSSRGSRRLPGPKR